MINTLMNDVGLSCVVFLIITLLLKFVMIVSNEALKDKVTQVYMTTLLVLVILLALSELFMIVLLMLQLNLVVVATIVICIKFLNYKID
jgi:hypothetical protein